MLYQSNLVTPEQYSVFVAESSASAILDSGASATVAGVTWLETYFNGLSEKQQQQVEYSDSSSSFKFGSGKRYHSLYKVKIPAKIGSKKLFISTDVVEAEIPLLLSKDAMKKAGTEINFVKDSVTMYGEELDVQITQSGHYAIPLNDSKRILKDIDRRNDAKVNLVIQSSNKNDKFKIAQKLHAQFAHPPRGKLVKLIERAGMGGDKEMIQAIDKVHDGCRVCKEYKKPTPTPAVGLAHATKFN